MGKNFFPNIFGLPLTRFMAKSARWCWANPLLRQFIGWWVFLSQLVTHVRSRSARGRFNMCWEFSLLQTDKLSLPKTRHVIMRLFSNYYCYSTEEFMDLPAGVKISHCMQLCKEKLLHVAHLQIIKFHLSIVQ